MLTKSEVDIFNKRISFRINSLVNDVINSELLAIKNNELIKQSILECIDSELTILEGIILKIDSNNILSNNEIINLCIKLVYTFNIETFSFFPDYYIGKIKTSFNCLYDIENQFKQIVFDYINNKKED